MEEIQLRINNTTVSAAPGTTIMQAAKAAGIDIPHLCLDPRMEASGSCRMCVVKVEGRPKLMASCTTEVEAGMKVCTEDEVLSRYRKGIMEMVFSEHAVTCPTCDRDGECSLQDYGYRYGVDLQRLTSLNSSGGKPNYTSLNRGIVYDADKCIYCGLCVRYCDEVQMASALTLVGRGHKIEVSTAFGMDLHESSCEMCGGCIRVCPAGAMLDKNAIGKGRDRDLTKVRTTCTYCGVGCEQILMVDPAKNRIVRATADPGSPINNGNLCVKGHFAFEFVSSPERLTTPLIKRDGVFEEASWDEAVEFVGRRLGEIRGKYGPDSLAFLSSARCTNEENYLMQKLARAAAGTNNIDQCATTCHAPSVEGLAASLGSGAMTNSVSEIQDVDVIFAIGANPTEAHPIVGLELKRALRKGAKLIVCDPRSTWLARNATIHIQHIPGTDNMLINAIMKVILDEGLADEGFIERRTEGFDDLVKNLDGFSVEQAARECDVPVESIQEAARLYAKGQPSAIFYTLGITEHACGTDNVKNLANLAMLCGQIGKRSSGINPLRGQNNVQGACDMGAMGHTLPGYQRWENDAIRARFEQAWGVELSKRPGGKITEFIERMGQEVKALYVMGEDPVTTEPNYWHVVEKMKSAEFIVCQEIFMTETAKMADVILPGACWAEKDGTFTASERRVQRVRKAVNPPGQAKPDWEIIGMVSSAMGYPMSYPHASAIFDELASLIPSYGGMSYDRLEQAGLQWPCPDAGHPGTPILHLEKFTRGLGKFYPIAHQPPRETIDEEYPFILSTGRTLYHYNNGSMTRKSSVSRQKEDGNFVEIHPKTAVTHGIAPGSKVEIRTRRGAVIARAEVVDRVRPDMIWMPFHFAESMTNVLTNDVFDPDAGTPEYKCCAAAIAGVRE